MNYWTELSVQFANQRNYLDELFRVYPISENIRRELNENDWNNVVESFENRDNEGLVRALLQLELFPLKDSYVGFLRNDPTSISRNPETINRLAGRLRELSLDEIYEKCTEPKETNRQMGQAFKRWINQEFLGAPVFRNIEDFLRFQGNAVLNVSDQEAGDFARVYLGYNRDRNKGLDFVARFHNKYVIGEAKFITTFGGNQNHQVEDVESVLTSELTTPNILGVEVKRIAICDGVLYIRGRNEQICRYVREHDDQIILSSLVLREYLYSL